MLGKYDRIDLVDLVYRDRIYPDTYLLTGDGVEPRELEVDLTGDFDFNEMQITNRKTACRLNDIQDLFDFLDAIDIYYKPYCPTPDTLLVGGEKDCLIQPDLTFDWVGIGACSKITSSRSFTKYPQSYVKANTYSLSDYQIVGFTPDEYERLKRVVGNNYSFTDDTFGYIKSPDGAFSIDISAIDAPDVGVIPEWTVFQLDVKDNGTTYNEDIDIGTLDISLSYDEQVDYLIAKLEDTIRYMH